MKISVIIPVYNVEPYIERCLLSALNQTYQDIEIILVDDCGQDRSMEIAKKVILRHRRGYRVKIRKHSQNRGLSAARNTGIEASTGKYVYFLDSDDEMTLDCIERIASFPGGLKPDFMIGNIRAIGRSEYDFLPMKLSGGLLTGNTLIFRDYLNWNWPSYACNKLIDKEFLLKHKLFFKEDILYEDTLWSFMVASHAETMGVITDYTYHYYRYDTSITAMDYEKKLPHKLSVLQLIVEYTEANNLALNGLIYNYLETSKAVIFMCLIREKSNLALKKRAYSFFRRCKLKEATVFIKPFSWKLRDYHYRIPHFLGFRIYYASLWLYLRFVWNKH
jgi:glycosyltransferase involved in cell wall biosynthesis